MDSRQWAREEGEVLVQKNWQLWDEPLSTKESQRCQLEGSAYRIGGGDARGLGGNTLKIVFF